MNIVLGFEGDHLRLVPMVKAGLGKEDLVVDDVMCLYSKKAIEEHVSTRYDDVDVVILNERVEAGNPYTEKEIERLSSISESVSVILIVSKGHMGDAFMQNLFNLGYYNALYDKDSSMSNIAALIKSGRSRRVAMAYYGVTGANINEGKKLEVMTIGMALDLVRECGSPSECAKVLRHVYTELGDVTFAQFVKHLPHEIYEFGATMEDLSDFFPMKVSSVAEVPTQYKDVKNEVIAVIDETETNSRASFLSMAIARGIATHTSLEPSYIKLPYTKDEMYDLFDFPTEFKAEFISHLQAIMKGIPYPIAKNMYNGVNVICRNPVVDILDDWDLLCSYKCIYNASHPAVLDVGKDIENEQMMALLKEVSMWCVVVPEEVPVNAYLLDLKNRIGANADIPIIAVTKTGRGVRTFETHSEIGIIPLYDDVPLSYEKNEQTIKELVGLTPYAENVVSTPKKFLKPSKTKFVPAKLQGTKEISILGSGHGCGCTYACVSIASLLAKYYKVAVVEVNDSHDFECMGANIKCKKYTVDNAITYSYKGVDYFYGCTHDYFHAYLRSGYDFVIYDCGVSSIVAFRSADVKIAVVPGAVWRMDEVDVLASELDEFDKKREVSCIVNGRDTRDLSDYRILTHRRSVYGLPFLSEPYSADMDFAMVVSRIVGVTVK